MSFRDTTLKPPGLRNFEGPCRLEKERQGWDLVSSRENDCAETTVGLTTEDQLLLPLCYQ